MSNTDLPQACLSVCIVSWNTRERLRACLSSLLEQLRSAGLSPMSGAARGSQVVVVDNASADGSEAMVRECFPWVRLIANRDNVGFARGCNQAIATTTGEYVLLLNPDAEVQPEAIDELVRFMDGTPAVGAAGARLLNSDGSLQEWCFPEPTLARELWRMFHLDRVRQYALYDMRHWSNTTPREVDTVPGACFLVRRSAVADVGLLDERYFIYSEEVDLCRRLRQRGWKIFWVPRAVVVHHAGQSTRQVAPAMFVRLYQGKILYFRKHHGRLAASLYKLILGMAASARLLASPAIWFEPPPARLQHWTLVGHYRRLLRELPRL
jgi:GT2 family glycosyltransferase